MMLKPKIMILIAVILNSLFLKTIAQKYNSDQIIDIKAHETEPSVVVASIYTKNKNLIETWELGAFKERITVINYNSLIDSGLLVPHGQHTVWNSDLKKLQTTYYILGEKNGPSEYYYPSGQLRSSINYADGKPSGLAISYYENGEAKSLSNFKQGFINDKRYTFYSNGAKRSELNFKLNNLDGPSNFYHPNGSLKAKIIFRNSKLQSSVSYNEEGEKLKRNDSKNIDGLHNIDKILNKMIIPLRDTLELLLGLELSPKGEIIEIEGIEGYSDELKSFVLDFFKQNEKYLLPPLWIEDINTILELKIIFVNGKPIEKLNSVMLTDYEIETLEAITIFQVSNHNRFFEFGFRSFFEKDNSTMPSFKGGINNLYKYLSENMPKLGNSEVDGRIVVEFEITNTGKIENITILSSDYPHLNSEFIRIVQQMPDWEPGMIHGNPVKTSFILPFNLSTKY
jgi:antitoxin component YwqK of YwqJK toxin-antitoxin module